MAWALKLIPRGETSMVESFSPVNNTDLISVIPVISDSPDDSNEIYNLFVHEKFMFDDEIKLIVLQAETTGCPMYEDESVKEKWGHAETFHETVKTSMSEVESQTLDDYLARNKTAEPLTVSIVDVPYVLVKDSDLPDDKFDRFWTKFYRKYPNSSGIVFFSKVGFNYQHNQAFLYAGRTCGGLCGEGEYVLLSKVDGRWRIVKEQALWVS
jgi:hypothetical protein